ncbi:DUF6241 domain-containing protein [Paenibacillus sp. CC-CFT747]|nr:DUF6241 domain-containing protein [Paenibacillus sp. CC-CFT747]
MGAPEKLLEIARKWKAGDFSTVDQDHNFFWGLEGGNLGKAEGILSAAEEKEFIEKTFK